MNPINVTARVIPPYIHECLFNKAKPCKYPGYNAELFSTIATLLSIDVNYIQVASFPESTEAPCNSSIAPIRCGLADSAANMIYLQDSEMPFYYDSSLPVDFANHVFYVPQIGGLSVPGDFLNGFSLLNLFKGFEMTALISFGIFLCLRPKSINIIVELGIFFLLKQIESFVVKYTTERYIYQPIFKTRDELVESILSGKTLFAATDTNVAYMASNNLDGPLRAISDYIQANPSARLKVKSATAAVQAVLESADGQWRRPDRLSWRYIFDWHDYYVVTTANINHLRRLSCEDRKHLFTGYSTHVSHLSYIFTKHSRLRRLFDQVLRQMVVPGSVTEMYRNRQLKTACVSDHTLRMGLHYKFRFRDLSHTLKQLALNYVAATVVCFIEFVFHQRATRRNYKIEWKKIETRRLNLMFATQQLGNQ